MSRNTVKMGLLFTVPNHAREHISETGKSENGERES